MIFHTQAKIMLSVAVLVALAGCDSPPQSAGVEAVSGEQLGTTGTQPSTTRTQPATGSDSSAISPAGQNHSAEPSVSMPSLVNADEDVNFAPLTLNSLEGSVQQSLTRGRSGLSDADVKAVIEKLKPLQVLLGQWRGTTRREYEGFKAVDNHEWVWDLRTTPNQPALVVASDKSHYLRKGSLTWDATSDQFILTAEDAAGVSRRYLGAFSEPVHEIVGSDDKLHRVFRLEFNQDENALVAGVRPEEFWQIAFAQQENNRYLLEIGQRRARTDFRRFDTVSTQREGTSFAISDTDYGEKTCIISEGLGTTMVSYKGRDYWVCCSGCKAAFEEDPEKWIARAAERDKK